MIAVRIPYVWDRLRYCCGLAYARNTKTEVSPNFNRSKCMECTPRSRIRGGNKGNKGEGSIITILNAYGLISALSSQSGHRKRWLLLNEIRLGICGPGCWTSIGLYIRAENAHTHTHPPGTSNTHHHPLTPSITFGTVTRDSFSNYSTSAWLPRLFNWRCWLSTCSEKTSIKKWNVSLLLASLCVSLRPFVLYTALGFGGWSPMKHQTPSSPKHPQLSSTRSQNVIL